MAGKLRTGMERLMRLRDVQVSRARQEMSAAEASQRQAEQQASAARGAVAAFAGARHSVTAAPSLDLARYRQLVDGEHAADSCRVHCEAEALLQRQQAEQVAERLRAGLRQQKAVEKRHESLRSSLQSALDIKVDGQLSELWQNSRHESS